MHPERHREMEETADRYPERAREPAPARQQKKKRSIDTYVGERQCVDGGANSLHHIGRIAGVAPARNLPLPSLR